MAPAEGRSLMLTTVWGQVLHPPPWAAPRPPWPIQTSFWWSPHTGCSGQRSGASRHLGQAQDMQTQVLWPLRDIPVATTLEVQQCWLGLLCPIGKEPPERSGQPSVRVVTVGKFLSLCVPSFPHLPARGGSSCVGPPHHPFVAEARLP